MAFTVEDGSGLSNSNAYCSVAFVSAYLAETGDNAAWDALTASADEHAIVKASRYIDQRFGQLFLSERRLRTQAMEWPREDIYFEDGGLWIASTEIPIELQRATAEYASRESVTALITDPDSSRQVVKSSEKVGPITVVEEFSEQEYQPSALIPNAAISAYPTADWWIEKLIRSSQGTFLEKV